MKIEEISIDDLRISDLNIHNDVNFGDE